MKRRWLLLLVAAIMLLMFPMVSQAGGGMAGEVQLEGETAPGETVSESPSTEPTPAPTPTLVPTPTPVSQTETPAPKPSISINAHPASVAIGRELQLTVTLTNCSDIPYSINGTQVSWWVSNPNVEVGPTGKFYGAKEGTVTIRAYIYMTNTYDSCVITVTPKRVTSIEIAIGTKTFSVGDICGLSAFILPEDLVNKEVIWSSSDTSVVTIKKVESYIAQLTAVGAGTAKITAKLDDMSDSINVTVTGSGSTATIIPSPTSLPISIPTPDIPTTPRPSSASAGTPSTTPGSGEVDAPKPTRVPVQLDATGWEAAEEALTGMEAGSLGSIQTPDDTLVPVSLLQTLQQTQCALAIDMGGYTCTIDGVDLAEIPDDFGSVDIAMTMEKDAALSATCGGNAYELRFNYHGELPGVFTFRVKAEGSRPGDTIYVYYFDEEAGIFEGLLAATVDDEGYVSFGITHCSSYYIASEMIPGAKNNFEVPTEASAEPEAERSGFAAFIEDNYIAFWVSVYSLGSGVIVAAFVLIFRRKRKQRVDPVQHTYMKQ